MWRTKSWSGFCFRNSEREFLELLWRRCCHRRQRAVGRSLSGGLGTSEPSNSFALAPAKVAVAQRSNRDCGHARGKRKLLSLATRFGAESSFAQTRSPTFFQLRRALAQRFASELRTRNPGCAWSAPAENSLC